MLEQLTAMIREYTGDDELAVTKEQTLVGDLGLNSLDLMNLICEVEEVFRVEIPDRAIHGFKTIEDVMDYIEQQ